MKPTDVFVMFKHCPQCTSDSINTTNGALFECPQCGFVYFHNTAAAVAGIICSGEEVLFTVREKDPEAGTLDLPGGFVDFNEPLEKALTREVQEELGIAIDNWRYLSSYPNQYTYKGLMYHTCDAVFVTTLIDKPNLTLQAEEIKSVRWIKQQEIDPDLIGFESLQKAIKAFLSR